MLSFLFLFGSFSVSAYASNNENLIDSNLSNWVDIGDTDPNYFQPANVYDYGNGYNYIEVYPSSKSVLLVDLTEFLKIGESYRFSFGLPTTDGVNNSALTSCNIAWGLVDGGGYTDFPSIGASVFEIEINNENKSNYLGKYTTFEFTYTQGYKNTYLALVIEPRDNLNAYNYLQLYISDVRLERIESEEEGLLNSIINWLKDLKETVLGGFSGIGQNLINGFNNLKNGLIELKNNIIELPQKIGNAIKDLFVPSDDYFESLSRSFKDISEDRFGALFTVVDTLDNFFESFNANKTTEYIDIPVYTFDIMGYPFSFGGWRFRFIPDFPKIKEIVNTIKGFTNIFITFAFINGLKSKYDEIFGGD